jgi:AraC-like DNA-binding protein
VEVFVREPEVATMLVFRTTAEGRSDLLVVGPRTRGSYNPSKRLPVCVRVRLRPGQARAVFGAPAHELADQVVSLADLWDRVDEPTRVISRVTEELRRSPVDRLLEAALREMTRPGARLAEVADRLGVGERHLRNLFARDVGLSPKHYARISRVRTVLELAGRKPWAEVANRAGFFDQAHMIGDFRSMMGVSPGAFLAGRLPAVTPCGYPDQALRN